jgi:hypothetical protein
MADFSKQYCEIYDHGFPWDFDIEEIANELDPGYMNNVICEGFGFDAIGKKESGEIILHFRDWETGKKSWVNYKDYMAKQKLMTNEQLDRS